MATRTAAAIRTIQSPERLLEQHGPDMNVPSLVGGIPIRGWKISP